MAACLILILVFIKQKKPEYYGMLPDGATVKPGLNTDADLLGKGNEYATSVQEEEFTVREAFKTRAFWLLITASMGQIIAFSGVTVHLIPFLTDTGISATTAGFMMSLLVLFSAPARLIVGILTDRLGKNAMSYMLAGFYFLECLGISIFLFRPSLITIYVFLILFGIGNGAPGTLNILLRGRYFGRKSYGTITGFTSVITAPAGLLAPIYAGWIFDTTGSYTFAFWTLAALTAVSTILALLIRPPRRVRHSQVRRRRREQPDGAISRDS
jgi:cyanate permease